MSEEKHQGRFIHISAKQSQSQGDVKHGAHTDHKVDPGHHLCTTCNPAQKFTTNYISTTKYNVVSFLPLNLWEQFQKKANFYFLIVAIISLTPISPKTPVVSVTPLVFVLAVSAVKEAIEDYARYKMDKAINNTAVATYRHGKWHDIAWKDILVGDIVKVVADTAFPADLVLLKSSANLGICTIETANLDGETNLKTKQAIPETYNIACSPDGTDYPKSLPDGTMESSGQNKRLDEDSWKGSLLLAGHEKQPLNFSQLLLRGCTLRNTKWIIGLVTFTGSDTKIMLNFKKGKMKRSNVDKIVDRALYVLFTMQFCLCSMGTILNFLFMENTAGKHWYLPYVDKSTGDKGGEAALGWLTFLVLLDILVPISLYVSMELVKFTQAWFIDQDLDMYYAKNDQPAQARTSNLNEELGQVDYIFSDKTGTLTGNIMQFLYCSIGGTSYGLPMDEQGNERKIGQVEPVPLCKGIPPTDHDFEYKDPTLIRRLIDDPNSSKTIDEFLTLLATCHTVLPDFPGCSQDHIHRIGEQCVAPVKYQAASPDEKALVVAAKNFQYYFYHRDPKTLQLGNVSINGERMILNILGNHQEFDVLESFPFTSSRARMSVIIRDPRDGLIKLYCKGSDAMMYKLLTKESKDGLWGPTEIHCNQYAKVGLRTLICAYKVIEPSVFAEWMAKHKLAKAAVADRESLVAESQNIIEQQLTLLGATAIEDKLQAGVPETIANLARAGIKIWVLTGDKVETAINIARSCRLVTPKMDARGHIKLVIKDKTTLEEAHAQTVQALDQAWGEIKNEPDGSDSLALVVSGKALDCIFPSEKKDPKTGRVIKPSLAQHEAEEKLKNRFLDVCKKCKAVVCCRVSPLQKADVVSLVKSKVNCITLAIGDGANDVSMIKAAHVGIGIIGLEGLQAVMASDYAIAQFRFLEKLLLVHGAWSYRRTSLLILYSFYKNISIAMQQIWFAFHSGFSAQMYYDPYAGSAFNLVYTAFPVMLAAIFNKNVSKESSIKYPELYASGQTNSHFSLPLLGLTIMQGIFNSLVLFFISNYFFTGTMQSDGTINDVWTSSTAMYSFLVIVVTARIAIDTTTWNFYTHLFLYLSVAVWFGSILMYCSLEITPNMYWVAERLFADPAFWLLSLLVPVICLLPYVVFIYVRRTYFPTPIDIVAERDRGFGTPEGALMLDSPTFDASRTSVLTVQTESKATGNTVVISNGTSEHKTPREVGPSNPSLQVSSNGAVDNSPSVPLIPNDGTSSVHG